MENTDNQNTVCHIAYTKLFKLSFQRASGSDSPLFSDVHGESENDKIAERLTA